MLRHYFITLTRDLLRHKRFSLINILGLTLAMTASLLILTFVGFELSFDDFHDDQQRIYRVTGHNDGMDVSYASLFPTIAPKLAERIPEVETAARLFQRRGILRYAEGEMEKAFKESNIAFGDSGFLRIFSFEGLPEKGLDRPFSLWLSETTAKKYFANESAIGKKLTLFDDFGEVSYTVIGIFPDLPANSHIQFDLLFSFHHLTGDIYQRYHLMGWRAFDTYIKVTPNASEERIAARLPIVFEEVKVDEQTESIHLQPLADIHLNSNVAYDHAIKGNPATVNFMLILAAIILILAWINYINLSTARAIDRAREVGIRKVLGSTRQKLIAQFLFEALSFNVIAALLALTIAQVLFPVFGKLFDQQMGEELLTGFPWSYKLLMGGGFLLSTLLAGLYPAFVLSAYQPVKVLKGTFSKSQKGQFLRKALVVIQFGVSVILITGTLGVYQQVKYMQAQSLGVTVEETLVIESPKIVEDSTYTAQMAVLQQELTALAGVEEAFSTGYVPGKNYNFGTQVRMEESAASETQICNIAYIQAGFFAHYEIDILYGKAFSTDLNPSDQRVIVNEALLRLIGLPVAEETLGKRLQLGDSQSPATITGIARDYHNSSLQYDYDPIVFGQKPVTNYLSIRLQTSGKTLSDLLGKVQERYEAIFPGNPYLAVFLDDVFAQQYQENKQSGRLVGAFALLAIFIACMGLYGLSSLNSLQRRKEIGIRKVMGASLNDLLQLLAKDYVRLLGVAMVLGLPLAAYGLSQWLEGFAFQMEMGWALFALPAVLTALIACLTIGWQVVQTARTNPVEALRDE